MNFDTNAVTKSSTNSVTNSATNKASYGRLTGGLIAAWFVLHCRLRLCTCSKPILNNRRWRLASRFRSRSSCSCYGLRRRRGFGSSHCL